MRSRLRSALPYLLILPGFGYEFRYALATTEGNTRLYWEYAGRIAHRAFVPGYVEWVHHRSGGEAPVTAAKVIDRRLAPYTDFDCEYPPGALLVFTSVRLPFDEPRSYYAAFRVLMAASSLAMAVLLVGEARRSGRFGTAIACSIAYSSWVVLVGMFTADRFDAVTAFLGLLGMLAWTRGRPSVACLLLGLGGSVKLWPALLVPVLALARPAGLRHHGPRPEMFRSIEVLLACAAGFVGFLMPHLVFLWLGTNPRDVAGYLKYLADRPIEVESVSASVVMVGHFAGLWEAIPVYSFGSDNLLTPVSKQINWVAGSLLAIGYGAVLVASWKRWCGLDPGRSFATCGFVVGLTMATSKVFSGEYMIWIMPFCMGLALAGRWQAFGWYALTLIFQRMVFRYYLDSVTALQPICIAAFVLRNTCFLALVGVLAWQSLHSTTGGPDRAPGDRTGPENGA